MESCLNLNKLEAALYSSFTTSINCELDDDDEELKIKLYSDEILEKWIEVIQYPVKLGQCEILKGIKKIRTGIQTWEMVALGKGFIYDPTTFTTRASLLLLHRQYKFSLVLT